jgi:hypothetical protein
MTFKGWPKVTIRNDKGEDVPAIAPLIVSASRATDIPAFYGEWFMKRLDAGHVAWINPWNGKQLYVSFANARVFVFWSKNPTPFLPCLEELDKRGLHYYFQVTLNDYEAEGLEKGVPPLADRIATFKKLSDMIGPPRVLWRFDPLLLTENLSAEELGERVYRLGRSLSGRTERCTVSFLESYKKVVSNLVKAGVRIRPWDKASRSDILKIIAEMGRENRISAVSCAMEDNLRAEGIVPGKCVDDDLIVRLFGHDEKLQAFFGVQTGGSERSDCFDMPERMGLKDKGQRPSCKCIVSKDIGSYNTCGHQCVYCYANTSPLSALKNGRNVHSGRDRLARG